jgi:hypothetical protein
MRILKRFKKGLSMSVKTVLLILITAIVGLITIAIIGVVIYFAFHYILVGSSSGTLESFLSMQ